MTSTLRTLADAYADLLDAGPLYGVCESVVTYMPRIEPINADTIRVWILPVKRFDQRLSIGGPGECSVQQDTTLQIVLYRHCDIGDAENIESADELPELAESIIDASLGWSTGSTHCIGCEMTAGDNRVLDLDELEQRNSYCAVLEVLFREIN